MQNLPLCVSTTVLRAPSRSIVGEKVRCAQSCVAALTAEDCSATFDCSACSATYRRGVLTVEMAICLPILFLILLGALEFSRMNMLRNSIDNAAYEGARRGVVPGATASDCTNSAISVLTAVGARSATVSVVPPVIDDTTMQVSVTISVPLSSNSWGPARFLSGATLRSVSTKSREFVGPLVPTSVP